MKVIFLDVDGVLNFSGSEEKVLEEKITLLKKIVDETQAQIVLSSDWRIWWDKKDGDFLELESKLKEDGLALLDKTPDSKHGYRGAEIYQWIQEWTGENIESFVILDDRDDMKLYMDELVQTSLGTGLTIGDMEKAIRILNN